MKLLINLLLLPFMFYAQMPECDIWVMRLKATAPDTFLQVVAAYNITGRVGYDNQPSFTSDSKKVLYSSTIQQQNDLFIYHLNKKTNQPFCNTTESEFSPQAFNGAVYAVVVEKDSSQTIHSFSEKTGTTTTVLLPDSVGYYAWVNQDTLLYYKLTQPHSLWAYAVKANKEWEIAKQPIRTFKPLNRTQFVYGIKDSLRVVYLMYDFLLQKARIMTVCENGVEDFCLHPKLGLIRPDKSKLLYFDAGSQQWRVWCDLSGFGIKEVSRVTFSPDGKWLSVSEIQR